MTSPSDRIEAAARARYERDEIMHRGGTPWEKLGHFAKQYRHMEAALDLAAAYPELTNGTAWIAPISPTIAMMAAMDDEREQGRHAQAIYDAMRDAYLQDQPKDKAE